MLVTGGAGGCDRHGDQFAAGFLYGLSTGRSLEAVGWAWRRPRAISYFGAA